MNTSGLKPADDGFAARIVDAFEKQTLPPRPSNETTVAWISENATIELASRSRSMDRKIIVRCLAAITATAACVAVLATLWPVGNSAFAQVIERMAEAQTVKFSISMQKPNQLTLSGEAVALRPHLLRVDWMMEGHTDVNITDYRKNELIAFSDDSPVRIHALPDSGGLDVVRQLQSVDVQRTREIPESVNEIANTDMFEFTDGPVTGLLWTDEGTGLPVRIEMYFPEEVGGGRSVFSDFQWDVEVDESVFSIPEGRPVVRENLLAAPTEEELIAALRIRQAFSSEPYSEDFLAKGVSLAIGQLAWDRDLSPRENHQRQLETLGPVMESIGLTRIAARDAKLLQQRIDYLCMKADQWASNVAHFGGWVGAGVEPGENKPLCWWQLPGRGIRVLHADLTICDAETPPEVD